MDLEGFVRGVVDGGEKGMMMMIGNNERKGKTG